MTPMRIFVTVIFLTGFQVCKIFATQFVGYEPPPLPAEYDSRRLPIYPRTQQIVPIYPRIVTDLNEIYGPHGVPVQLNRYNETQEEGYEFASVPGCPKSIENYSWIYYGYPTRCYLADHTGPCPIGEKLFRQIGSPYGACACECLSDPQTKANMLRSPDRFFHCKDPTSEDAPHGQLYDKIEKKCHRVFEEGSGPCEDRNHAITGWTGNSFQCRPLCDEEHERYLELRDNGECGMPPSPFGNPPGASPQNIQGNECKDGEVFSERTMHCGPPANSDFFV